MRIRCYVVTKFYFVGTAGCSSVGITYAGTRWHSLGTSFDCVGTSGNNISLFCGNNMVILWKSPDSIMSRGTIHCLYPS